VSSIPRSWQYIPLCSQAAKIYRRDIARPSRSQDQTGLNAETQKNAEKRREKELCAAIVEIARSLRRNSAASSVLTVLRFWATLPPHLKPATMSLRRNNGASYGGTAAGNNVGR